MAACYLFQCRALTLLARKLCELDPNFVPCKIDLAKVNVSAAAAAANLIRENSGKGSEFAQLRKGQFHHHLERGRGSRYSDMVNFSIIQVRPD